MVEEYLSYNKDTGELTWIKRPALCVKVGSVASAKTSDGYYAVCVKGKQYKAHRVCWFLHYGEWPSGDIDHINRNKLDNRIDNLRVVTAAENQLNTDRGASGELYITKYKDRWQVRGFGGKSLGYADTIEEAKAKRDFYEEKL